MQNPKQLNPVTLAFLGDAVYEARVRTAIITRHHSLSPGKLHYLCVQYVKAEGQYQALQAIQPLLSEEEQAIVRRGRNYSGVTAPKNADVRTYRYATGLEALFGYLHLKGDTQRIDQLFDIILQLNLDQYTEIV